MKLREVEMWMTSAITGSEADASAPERVLTAGPRLTAAERLDIHRFGYRARLVECLADDYPIVQKALGDEFKSLCHAYIERHPSSSPNLNAFGRHMSAFCASRGLAFVSELAALEWALVEVLHAETAPPLDAATLQAIPVDAWPNARFVKSDALRLLRFDYPVNAYFTRSRLHDEDPEVPSPSPTVVAVYRQDLTLWRMDLTPSMTRVLAPLIDGATFGDALAAIEADESDPEGLADIGQNLMVWFREWAAAGFFARIDL